MMPNVSPSTPYAALRVVGKRLAIALGSLLVLTGCNTVGTIGERANSINVMTSGYAASSILYNLVRASYAESLQFNSITSVTGHDTVTASLGLPTIIFGPGRTAAQQLYLFGGNTIGGTESNDFNISVEDDPASFAALLKPVDPATIGFFINQGYSQKLIFYLFVSKIEIYNAKDGSLVSEQSEDPIEHYSEDPNKAELQNEKQEKALLTIKDTAQTDSDNLKTKIANSQPGAYQEYLNELKAQDDALIHDLPGNSSYSDSTDSGYFPNVVYQTDFLKTLDKYLDDGLTVEVDPTYVPNSKSGDAQFCFDYDQWSKAGLENFSPDSDAWKKITPHCPRVLPKPKPDKPPAAVAARDSLVTSSRLALDITVGSQPQDQKSVPDFSFKDSDGQIVQFQTRSVLGAYRYLGELISLEDNYPDDIRLAAMDDLFQKDPTTDFIHVNHDRTGCWTSVDYNGKHWCVDDRAQNTKRVFQVLHQMFELYASPNNTPATSTVRVTPG